MALPNPDNTPSKWWWVAHIFFGFITGLTVYVVWNSKNPKAAKKHLIHSLWIGCLAFIIPIAILFSFVGLSAGL